ADGDIGDVEEGRLHLRGNEAIPDQFVEVVLLAGEVVLDRLRIVLQRRGANGLVGLLRLCSFLDTIYVRLFGKNIRTVFRADILSHFGNSIVADADRIGAHVGDQADVSERAQLFAFVEL